MTRLSPTEPTRHATKRRVSVDAAQLVWMLCMHGFFTVLIASLLAWCIADYSSFKLFLSANDGELLRANAGPVVMHIVGSALLWMALYLGVKGLGPSPKKRIVRTAQRARGAVMLETLIVLVPFLLLLSGLSQLLINNIAGILTHVGAYQAGRAYWVWQHEGDRAVLIGESTLPGTTAARMARLAAAGAVAPVAPSSLQLSPSSTPDEVRSMRGFMFAHFSSGSMSGTNGMSTSTSALSGGRNASSDGKDFDFPTAFDTDSFPARAARKLTFAYEAVRVDTSASNDTTIRVDLTYSHYAAFPWFGYIFGSEDTIGGRTGYFTAIQRTYTLPSQVVPR